MEQLETQPSMSTSLQLSWASTAYYLSSLGPSSVSFGLLIVPDGKIKDFTF